MSYITKEWAFYLFLTWYCQLQTHIILRRLYYCYDIHQYDKSLLSCLTTVLLYLGHVTILTLYIIWHDMIWLDKICYSMIWYDMVWYDKLIIMNIHQHTSCVTQKARTWTVLLTYHSEECSRSIALRCELLFYRAEKSYSRKYLYIIYISSLSINITQSWSREYLTSNFYKLSTISCHKSQTSSLRTLDPKLWQDTSPFFI